MSAVPPVKVVMAGKGNGGLSRVKARTSRSPGRKWKVLAAEWVDPYPFVLGTLPEKLVFAWLADRKVPFIAQYMVPDFPGTLTVEEFRADFYLPWCHTFIEVQGEYWHSQPAQAANDAYKFAIYEAMGCKVAWLWESEILENLGVVIMEKVPELQGYHIQGGYSVGNNVDDLAGLRKTNAGRTRPPSLAIARRRVKSGSRTKGLPMGIKGR